MAGIYGLVGLAETDYAYALTAGQDIIYRGTQMYLDMVNTEVDKALAAFVQMDTFLFAERYKLAGGGTMQRRGRATQPASTKASGSYDVGYPLEDFSDALSADDVTLAYMTPGEYQQHVDNIAIRYTNTVRTELLVAQLSSVNRTFIDEFLPTPTVTAKPLANGDTDTYPPLIGTRTEITAHQHYVGTNYAVSAISNTNNPVLPAVLALQEHTGFPQGGGSVAYFAKSDIIAKLAGLTGYVAIPDIDVRYGVNQNLPTNLPSVPGTIMGRFSGAWIIDWEWIPSNYAFAIDLNQPAPLKRRVDPPGTGLSSRLSMVAQRSDFPIESAIWRARFGFGVANRLNGYAQFFTGSTSYTDPTL